MSKRNKPPPKRKASRSAQDAARRKRRGTAAPGATLVAGPQEQPDHPPHFLFTNPRITPPAAAPGSGGDATTVLPRDWPAERDQALRRLDEILPVFEKTILPYAAEIEADYRKRAGIGGNRPPPSEAIEPPLEVATVRVWIDNANVYRTQLSNPQPSFEAIRASIGALKIATKLIGAGLAMLAASVVQGAGRDIGRHIIEEVWPSLEPTVHDLIVQAEGWLRTLGL